MIIVATLEQAPQHSPSFAGVVAVFLAREVQMMLICSRMNKRTNVYIMASYNIVRCVVFAVCDVGDDRLTTACANAFVSNTRAVDTAAPNLRKKVRHSRFRIVGDALATRRAVGRALVRSLRI